MALLLIAIIILGIVLVIAAFKTSPILGIISLIGVALGIKWGFENQEELEKAYRNHFGDPVRYGENRHTN